MGTGLRAHGGAARDQLFCNRRAIQNNNERKKVEKPTQQGMFMWRLNRVPVCCLVGMSKDDWPTLIFPHWCRKSTLGIPRLVPKCTLCSDFYPLLIRPRYIQQTQQRDVPRQANCLHTAAVETNNIHAIYDKWTHPHPNTTTEHGKGGEPSHDNNQTHTTPTFRLRTRTYLYTTTGTPAAALDHKKKYTCHNVNRLDTHTHTTAGERGRV